MTNMSEQESWLNDILYSDLISAEINDYSPWWVNCSASGPWTKNQTFLKHVNYYVQRNFKKY